jgi:hypothetical protein
LRGTSQLSSSRCRITSIHPQTPDDAKKREGKGEKRNRRKKKIEGRLKLGNFVIIQPAMPMDQRELESRVKALTKVVAANEPPENALKLLELLKKEASPTEEMLRVR